MLPQPLSRRASLALAGRNARFLFAAGAAILIALLLGVWAISIVYGVRYWLSALTFPYSLDYGEGGILAAVLEISNWRALYTPFDQPPYTVENYPPVFAAIIAGLSHLTGQAPLATGRFVSIAAAFIGAIAIGTVVWRVSRDLSSRALCWVAAVVSASLFLSRLPVVIWTPLLRVDLFALAFSLVGLATFAWSRWRATSLVVACVAFILAGFTRPITVSALIACCGVALLARPKIGVAMIAGCAAAAVTGIMLLDVATGGEFYRHVIAGNAGHAWDIGKAGQILEAFAKDNPGNLLLAAGAIFMLFSGLVQRAPEARPSPSNLFRPSDSPNPGVLICAYFGVATLVALASGKDGAAINYLLELASATALLAGVAIVYCWAIIQWRHVAAPRRQYCYFATAAAAVLTAAAAMQVSKEFNNIGIYELVRTARISDLSIVESDRIVQVMRDTPGDVLTEDRLLAALAGKRIYFEFADGSRLINAGALDPAALEQQIDARAFPLIVVGRRTDREITSGQSARGFRFLSPILQRRIAANYERAEVKSRFVVYMPKSR